MVVKLVVLVARRFDRRRTAGFFGGAQIAGAAAMAFMHGAQDGQKFMGVFMLGMFLSRGSDVTAGGEFVIRSGSWRSAPS